jgi:hypothetical protein
MYPAPQPQGIAQLVSFLAVPALVPRDDSEPTRIAPRTQFGSNCQKVGSLPLSGHMLDHTYPCGGRQEMERLVTQKQMAEAMKVSPSYLRASDCPKVLLPGNGKAKKSLVRYDPEEVAKWWTRHRTTNPGKD